jgi:hypothetical protein
MQLEELKKLFLKEAESRYDGYIPPGKYATVPNIELDDNKIFCHPIYANQWGIECVGKRLAESDCLIVYLYTLNNPSKGFHEEGSNGNDPKPNGKYINASFRLHTPEQLALFWMAFDIQQMLMPGSHRRNSLI